MIVLNQSSRTEQNRIEVDLNSKSCFSYSESELSLKKSPSLTQSVQTVARNKLITASNVLLLMLYYCYYYNTLPTIVSFESFL